MSTNGLAQYPACRNSGSDGPHHWRLVEDGYARIWESSTVDVAAKRVVAGSDVFSADGDGVDLMCINCFYRHPVDDTWHISFI